MEETDSINNPSQDSQELLEKVDTSSGPCSNLDSNSTKVSVNPVTTNEDGIEQMETENCLEGEGEINSSIDAYYDTPTDETVPELAELLSDELQQGYRILRELMNESHKAFTWPFMDAVDDSHSDTSDYYDVVDNPMWLKRMKEKFTLRLYESLTQFVGDFRVMLENCYRYNGPDHFISKRGQRLEMMLEQKLALLSRELREKTSVAATSGGKIEETFSSAMRRRVKSTYQRDTSALLNQLRHEEAQREKEIRRQQILDRKAANESLIQEQVEWENTLLQEPIKTQMNGLWELPQIGHFLFLCQEPLNVGEIPQFELERGFAMPRQSSCLQKIMTTLLSTQHQRTKLDKTGMMPYSVWNEKLQVKLTAWYKCLTDFDMNTYRTANKLGIDSFFFDVIGKKNPLDRKKYHELSYYRKIWIIKSLCDHCLETQESIRDAIERQPIPEQHEYLIGYDTKGNLYIHFPQFCGADLRIYRQEPFPEPGDSDEEQEYDPPHAKKIKQETPSKKSVNSLLQNIQPQTPDSAILRRSRRGQSDESCNSNNNSSVKSSGSKQNIINYDDTSNDSISLPFTRSKRKTKVSCRTPLFLDETSNDSRVSIPCSRRKRKGGKRKHSNCNSKNLKDDFASFTDSECMDESACSSVTECAINDRLSEEQDAARSNFANIESELVTSNVACDTENKSLNISGKKDTENSVKMITKNIDSKQVTNSDNKHITNSDNKHITNSSGKQVINRDNKQVNNSDSKQMLENSNISVTKIVHHSENRNSPTKLNVEKIPEIENNMQNSNVSTIKKIGCESSKLHNSENFTSAHSDLKDKSVHDNMVEMRYSETCVCENGTDAVKWTTAKEYEDSPISIESSEFSQQSENVISSLGNLQPSIQFSNKLGNPKAPLNEFENTDISCTMSKHFNSDKSELDHLDTHQTCDINGKMLEINSQLKMKKSSHILQNRELTSENYSKLQLKTEPIDESNAKKNDSKIATQEVELKIKVEPPGMRSVKVKEEPEDKPCVAIEIKEEPVEEELEPELGTFMMICDNVDDLRKLVEKFAEQEPIIVKRGKREKLVHPPPRKKCIVELHDRLAFLLSELEPWESKLNAAMRKARVKIQREFEDYEEEVSGERWESESESQTITDSSEDDSETSEAEETKPVKKEKTDLKAQVVKEERLEFNEDDVDFSSRGRLRKRRVIPNNSEDSMNKRKKMMKKEDAAPTHVPNILQRQVKSPVPTSGITPNYSKALALQPTSIGHTISIRSSLTDQPQSASQLLRLSVTNQKLDRAIPSIRHVPPSVNVVPSGSSHPVIQQLLAKQSSTKPQPTLVSSSLLNIQTQKTPSRSTSSAQPRIQYVITNQQTSTSGVTAKQPTTNLSSLPASLLQQLIKNQAVKIQQNSKGETQLVLAAPIQVTSPVRQESNIANIKGPLVITPTAALAKPTIPSKVSKPPASSEFNPVPKPPLIIHPPISSFPSKTPNSPGKPAISSKYASNVTVKALLENRAAKKSETITSGTSASTTETLNTATCSPTTATSSPNSEISTSTSDTRNANSSFCNGSVTVAVTSSTVITSADSIKSAITGNPVSDSYAISHTTSVPKKVVAKLLQIPVEIPNSTTYSSSISTSLPTINIKVPPPVTLPIIQPRKNITKTVQSITTPIPVTTKIDKVKGGFSSSLQPNKPSSNLVNSSGCMTLIAHPKVAAKSGVILQARPSDTNTRIQEHNKQALVPQNILATSPGMLQGFLTPQGLQIPGNMLNTSEGSIILQSPKPTNSTISASTLPFTTISAPLTSLRNITSSSVQLNPKTTLAASPKILPVRQPANYFIVQPPGANSQIHQVQLQKFIGAQNQIYFGGGQAVAWPAPASPSTSVPVSPTIRLKSPMTQIIPSTLTTPISTSSFVISPSNHHAHSSTMPASNLVRQLAADQQKQQLPAGQKAVGLQILRQQAVTQVTPSLIGLQGVLPSGQIVQLQPSSLGVKSSNVQGVQFQQVSQGVCMPTVHGTQQALKSPNIQRVTVNQGFPTTSQTPMSSTKVQPQTVLISPSGSDQEVPYLSSKLGEHQQILQHLQGQRLVQPLKQGSMTGSQQVQFHLNVTGNKLGIMPAPRLPTNNAKTLAIPQPFVSSGNVASMFQTPLNISIPNNSVTFTVTASPKTLTHSTTTNVTTNKGNSPQNTSPKKELVSVNQVPILSPFSAPKCNKADDKPHVVWPTDKTEHRKQSSSTKIIQLCEQGSQMYAATTTSENTNSNVDSSVVPFNSPTTENYPSKKSESPSKQKLLLYNIGGQLMTAQGVPVTVDQGVLKIVPQATIQIGSQTLTVRAPGQSPNEPVLVPISVGGKTSSLSSPASSSSPISSSANLMSTTNQEFSSKTVISSTGKVIPFGITDSQLCHVKKQNLLATTSANAVTAKTFTPLLTQLQTITINQEQLESIEKANSFCQSSSCTKSELDSCLETKSGTLSDCDASRVTNPTLNSNSINRLSASTKIVNCELNNHSAKAVRQNVSNISPGAKEDTIAYKCLDNVSPMLVPPKVPNNFTSEPSLASNQVTNSRPPTSQQAPVTGLTNSVSCGAFVNNGINSMNDNFKTDLNTVQSPEKEAAKNLLALANQTLSFKPR